jgi:DNA-directed RNA polymerase specialized sigma24 family protein
MTTPAVQRALEAAFREEWGRGVATLIGRTGHWDLAEDCAQEAFTRRCGAGRSTESRGVGAGQNSPGLAPDCSLAALSQ